MKRFAALRRVTNRPTGSRWSHRRSDRRVSSLVGQVQVTVPHIGRNQEPLGPDGGAKRSAAEDSRCGESVSSCPASETSVPRSEPLRGEVGTVIAEREAASSAATT